MTFHGTIDIATARNSLRKPLLQSTVARPVAGLAADAGVVNYENITVTIDPDIRTAWCHMNVPGKPIVTQSLLDDLRHMQDAMPDLNADFTAATGAPLTHFVFGSRTPGVYSLGGDLRMFVDAFSRGDRETIHHYARTCVDVVYQNINALDLPLITIGLVQGEALGGGFETALSFDMIIAERSSKMGLPEILFNLFPGMGAYSLLSRRLDSARAQKMIMSGRIYTAEELHEMGLVDVIAEDGCGEATVADYIQRNASKFNAHRAIHQARRRVNPITRDELSDIVDCWTDAVFQLAEPDIRKMTRLIAAQDRRFQKVQPAMVGCQA